MVCVEIEVMLRGAFVDDTEMEVLVSRITVVDASVNTRLLFIDGLIRVDVLHPLHVLSH